jgi:tetratricopeptide (TPR) repeat protein
MQKFVLAIALITSATIPISLSATASLSQPIAQIDMQLAPVNAASARSLNDEQQQLLKRAIEVAQTTSDPADQVSILVKIANLYVRYEQFDLAADFLVQALAISDTISNPQIRAQSLLDVIFIESWLPQPLNLGGRLEEVQALIERVPATIDRDPLYLKLAEIQAIQGQFDRFSRTLAQVQSTQRVEGFEYGAVIHYGFWAVQPEHFEQAIAQIEQAEQFPPLYSQPMARWQAPANLSASDWLSVNRVKMLAYLLEQAGSYRTDGIPTEQPAQLRVLSTRIQQQIARLQNADLQLQYRINLFESLRSSLFKEELQREITTQYDQLLAAIETSPSSALLRATLLSEMLVRLFGPTSPSPLDQSGVRLIETLLTQVDNSQVTGKVAVLHNLAALLREVQPERAIEFVQQADQLIAQIPQARDRAAAWSYSAGLYKSLGQPAAAVAALEQVTPLLAELEYPSNVAELWIELGRVDRVEQIAEQTRSRPFLFALFTFYFEQGKLEQAIAFKDRIADPFTQVGMLYGLSKIYLEDNRLDRAATFAQEAIALLQTIPPTDERPQSDLDSAFLTVIELYLKTGVPLDSVFQLADSIDQAEVQATVYEQWLIQSEVSTTQTAMWQRFEQAIAAIQDPELRDANWSRFALLARRLQPDRFEAALAAIENPQIKADTLLTLVERRQTNPDQVTP